MSALDGIVGPPESPPQPAGGTGTFRPFGEDGFSFRDLIDIVNPLQHIPVVSTIYRELTGDQLDPGARMAGGTLFGGPLGFMAALVNVISEAESGKDLGGHAYAALFGDDAPAPVDAPAVAVAAVEPAEDAGTAAPPWTPMVDDPSPIVLAESPRAGVGATAAGGGWFTDTMLSALIKYQEAQGLAQRATDAAAPADAI